MTETKRHFKSVGAGLLFEAGEILVGGEVTGTSVQQDRIKVKQRISGDWKEEYLGVGFEGLTVSRYRPMDWCFSPLLGTTSLIYPTWC